MTAARDPALTKNMRSGCWEAQTGLLRKAKRVIQRACRHGKRQAGKKETERSLLED
jgi:hypothetical protein